jgi:hypothetical protein
LSGKGPFPFLFSQSVNKNPLTDLLGGILILDVLLGEIAEKRKIGFEQPFKFLAIQRSRIFRLEDMEEDK